MRAVEAEASAPGKLILMGEHAAVYGAPAVVASLGLRTVAQVTPLPGGGGLTLDLVDLKLREDCSWEDLLAYGDRRRELWRTFARKPSAQSFAALRAGGAAGVVRIAMAETLRFLERDGGRSRAPLKLSVSSRLPIGSGLGSSASVAVAVVAALLAALAGQGDLAPGTVASIALEAEKRQHGQPSGIDHTTVMRGGFLLLTRTGEALEVQELPRPSWLTDGMRLFDTGVPAQTTGEVVAGVRELKDRDPDAVEATLNRMASSVRTFAAALASTAPAWAGLITAVKHFERCLEALGVVPAAVRQDVLRIEEAGGAAKISGAGALSGNGAGCLIVFWPPEVNGEPSTILSGYRPLAAELGGAGLECRRAGGRADVGI